MSQFTDIEENDADEDDYLDCYDVIRTVGNKAFGSGHVRSAHRSSWVHKENNDTEQLSGGQFHGFTEEYHMF